MNTLVSVKKSNFTLVILKTACHANPGAGIGGSSPRISRNIS